MTSAEQRRNCALKASLKSRDIHLRSTSGLSNLGINLSMRCTARAPRDRQGYIHFRPTIHIMVAHTWGYEKWSIA